MRRSLLVVTFACGAAFAAPQPTFAQGLAPASNGLCGFINFRFCDQGPAMSGPPAPFYDPTAPAPRPVAAKRKSTGKKARPERAAEPDE